MTSDPELTRIVRSWLKEGRTRLPDHVLNAVLAELPATPQRRTSWPARRIADMSPLAKFVMAAAAVTVIAIVGANVLRAPGPVGPAGSPPAVTSASPSSAAPPSPAPSSSTAAVPMGDMIAGRYHWTWQGGEVSFTVQDRWTGNADGITRLTPSGGEYNLSPYLPGTRSELTHVFADACTSEGQLQPIGPGVDDLVAALEDQAGTEVVTNPIAVGRARGTRVEIRQVPGLDRSTCRHGAEGPLQVWADEAETSYFALAPGAWGLVYALDVDGRRLVFSSAISPEDTDQATAALDDIVSSFDFGAPAAASLPALRLPGTRASPAGEYGWTGGPGSRAFMHKVNDREGREVAELVFTVGPGCLADRDRQEAVAVRVAGLDGVAYEPPAPSGGATDPVTRTHALAVGARTLCVSLTWGPKTTPEELAAAEDVLDTLRAEPMGDGIRITFTLDEGWDIG